MFLVVFGTLPSSFCHQCEFYLGPLGCWDVGSSCWPIWSSTARLDDVEHVWALQKCRLFPKTGGPWGWPHPYQRYHPFRINQVAVESSRLNLKGRRSNDSIRSTWACSGTGALGLRGGMLDISTSWIEHWNKYVDIGWWFIWRILPQGRWQNRGCRQLVSVNADRSCAD